MADATFYYTGTLIDIATQNTGSDSGGMTSVMQTEMFGEAYSRIKILHKRTNP